MKSKKNGNGKQVEAEVEEETTEVAKPKADRKRLVDLFHAWERSLETQKDLEAKLEESKVKTSACVKAILEANGPGPYGYHGDELKVVRRGPTEKSPEAKEVFYFRVKGKEDEIVNVG